MNIHLKERGISEKDQERLLKAHPELIGQQVVLDPHPSVFYHVLTVRDLKRMIERLNEDESQSTENL
jgi:hypothetical protein